MKLVDSGYDKLLWSNYELHSSTLKELKEFAMSWYDGIDLSNFDERKDYGSREEYNFIEMKRSGLTSNYFFAYRDQGGKYYLMDGFNRLFTEYGNLGDLDSPVYLKVITDNLEDWKLMHIMFRLNMWKLQGSGHWSFDVNDFFDRGFRLFLYKKFGIELYTYNNSNWEKRKRDRKDFEILNMYFRSEWIESDAFPHRLSELSILMSREKIVEDIKGILKINNYRSEPFNNYRTFVDVFVVFLSARRVEGDMGDYKFENYLKALKNDEKFFKKFQKMAGTDSTRKNAYTWIRDLQSTISSKRSSEEFPKSGEIKL